MDRWKTLSRQDPDFLPYLDGTFSRTHRALPTRSLNVATSREEVTFEIVPVSEIERPSTLAVAWRALRPSSLVLSLGPLLITWLYAWSRGFAFDFRLALSAVFGVLFFHIGMNLLDDYFDHRRGRDRVNPRAGSRAIQNGWVRARTMRDVGLLAIVVAILCGLPLVLQSPRFLLIIALTTLSLGLGFSSENVRLKYRGCGEIATFLLAGPLLTAGFSWATSGRMSWEFAVLGCAFGFTAVIYYHLKNIENIMVDSQANVRTLATRLGFDAAKKLVWFFAALSGLSILIFDWAAGQTGIFVAAFATHALVLIPVARRLVAAPSPLSSELREIRRRGLIVHWMTTGALAMCIAVYVYFSSRAGM
jgi:1,4-dihydroxy-2-naphthoate octaprenyltransferase